MPGFGRPDSLIDLKGLPQVCGSLSGVAVQKAPAYTFQRPCLFAGRAKLASDGERLGVMALGLSVAGGSQRQLAEAVQRFGLTMPVT